MELTKICVFLLISLVQHAYSRERLFYSEILQKYGNDIEALKEEVCSEPDPLFQKCDPEKDDCPDGQECILSVCGEFACGKRNSKAVSQREKFPVGVALDWKWCVTIFDCPHCEFCYIARCMPTPFCV